MAVQWVPCTNTQFINMYFDKTIWETHLDYLKVTNTDTQVHIYLVLEWLRNHLPALPQLNCHLITQH